MFLAAVAIELVKKATNDKEALKYCDKIYLTSDNPRNESLKKIFEDMKKGILKKI